MPSRQIGSRDRRTGRSRSGDSLPEVLAAVDLGSNSFHMVVARYSHGQLVIIDRLREMVRLASGVEENGRIDDAVAARAIACLQRFGQRLRAMRAGSVRAVGTSALRFAHRKQSFLERARMALGHPIEIISGREEARLIYGGVAHHLPREPGRRLVIDIGGGSTEQVSEAASQEHSECPDRTFEGTCKQVVAVVWTEHRLEGGK